MAPPQITDETPEDLGLSPLDCGNCGAKAIGSHPCPRCEWDPREDGPPAGRA